MGSVLMSLDWPTTGSTTFGDSENIDQMVQRWISGQNYGAEWRGAETGTYSLMMSSSESGANGPKLTVVYDETPPVNVQVSDSGEWI